MVSRLISVDLDVPPAGLEPAPHSLRAVSYTHLKSVAETLSYYCSNNFELEVWTELELSKESLEESPYDIIISNFIIPPIENKRLIYSNNINTVSLISLLNAMMFIRLD